MKLSRLTFGVLLGLRVTVVVVLTFKAGPAAELGNALGIDTPRYHEIAVAQGSPYRDFDVEYPPLTWGEIELVHGSTSQSTAVRLAWLNLALDALTILSLLVGWGRSVVGSYLVLTTPFVPLMYLQVDPLVIALTVLSLALVRLQHERAGGVLLASAAFAKLWPIVLIPVIAARHQWRAVGYALSAGALGVLAWVAWSGIAAPLDIFRFRGLDAWETGSAVGSFLRVAFRSPITFEGGTNRVGSVPTWLSVVLFLLIILFSVTAALLARRSGKWALAAIASVTSVLLLSNLFSPQYALWLVPFVAISGERRLQVLTGLVVVMSVGFLAYVSATVPRAGPLLDWAVFLRNLLVLGIGIDAVRLLWRHAREPSRDDPLAADRKDLAGESAA